MLISMTGYGRAEKKLLKKTICVEIQSYNRKYLETSVFNVPESFFGFEVELKKLVQSKINRGNVLIRLSFNGEKREKGKIPSKSLLLPIKKMWDKLAKDLGYEEEQTDLLFLLEQLKDFKEEPIGHEKEKKELLSCTSKAIDALCKMKKEEGKAIEKDLLARLKLILETVKKIEKNAKDEPNLYKEKLEKRVSKYFSTSSEDQDKILKEVVLFSDKVDTTEEITRLKSHLGQFRKMIESKETILGKKLDFLSQEMFREINTIGSKTYSVQNTEMVVQIKAELEKIREQIQNVE